MRNYSELDMIAFACDYAGRMLDNFNACKEHIPDPAKVLSEWKFDNKE